MAAIRAAIRGPAGAAGANGAAGAQGATGPAGGAWVTAFDWDLTAEASQTLTSDGTYSTTVGKTITKVNSAKDRVAMAFTNGSGLVLQPGATDTNVNAATCNPPGVTIPMASIITDFNLGMRVRVLAYISAFNGAGNGDDFVMAVGNILTGGNAFRHIMKRGYNSSASFQVFTSIQNADNGVTVNATLNSTNNVMLMDMVCGVAGAHIQGYSAGYSSGFPTISAANYAPYGGGATGGPTNTGPIAASLATSTVLLLGAHRLNSGTNLSVTLARLRVDYKE